MEPLFMSILPLSEIQVIQQHRRSVKNQISSKAKNIVQNITVNFGLRLKAEVHGQAFLSINARMGRYLKKRRISQQYLIPNGGLHILFKRIGMLQMKGGLGSSSGMGRRW